MRNLFLLSAIGLTISACASTSPCEEYVEALCDCATSDDECDEYKKQYKNPTSDDDEECSAGLDDAQADAESCDTGGSEG